MCLYQQGDGSIPTGFKWLRISIWDIGVIEMSNKQSYIYYEAQGKGRAKG